MNEYQIDSKEFFRACRELANETYKDKVSQEVLNGILALTPDVDNGLNIPTTILNIAFPKNTSEVS